MTAVVLEPLQGHRVVARHAPQVVAPPYDALTPDERAAMAAADPTSFLNVLPAAGPDADASARLRACRVALERLLDAGRFEPLPAGGALLVLGLGTPPDRVLGVVGDVEVAAFADGRILPHEQVDPARVAHLADHLDVVGMASSPVAVVHRPSARVTALTAEIAALPPVVAFRDEQDLDVALWIVPPERSTAMTAAIRDTGRLYVADGHHRAAAVAAHAARVATTAPATDGVASPSTGGSRPDRVLTAVLPSDAMQVHPFHRLLDLDAAADVGPSADEVVDWLRTRDLPARPLPGPTPPSGPGRITVTVEHRWWELDARAHRGSGPVESLDAHLVEQVVIGPLLGGSAPVGTGVLRPVAAPAGLRALERPGWLGIALAPPPVDAILTVADAGLSMPAKTTYVTPKLRSGLLLVDRSRDGWLRPPAP